MARKSRIKGGSKPRGAEELDPQGTAGYEEQLLSEEEIQTRKKKGPETAKGRDACGAWVRGNIQENLKRKWCHVRAKRQPT